MTKRARYAFYQDGELVTTGTIPDIADDLGLSAVTVGRWRWRPRAGAELVRIDIENRESKESKIETLKALVLELYEDLVESDECSSSWMVEKYGKRLVSLGVDIGDIGKRELMEAIGLQHRLYEQSSRPDYPYGPHMARNCAAKEAELRVIAEALGWGEVS